VIKAERTLLLGSLIFFSHVQQWHRGAPRGIFCNFRATPGIFFGFEAREALEG
jgi:hypothetical protein